MFDVVSTIGRYILIFGKIIALEFFFKKDKKKTSFEFQMSDTLLKIIDCNN